MFAPPVPARRGAYMGRKRVLRMLSLHFQGLLLLTAVSAMSKSVGRGCAPSSSAHVRSTARRDRGGEHGAPAQEEGFVLEDDGVSSGNGFEGSQVSKARPGAPFGFTLRYCRGH